MKFSIDSCIVLAALFSVVLLCGCAGQTTTNASANTSTNTSIVTNGSMVQNVNACATADCFVQAANACTAATYTQTQSYGTLLLESSNNCTYVETIANVSSDMPDIQSVLENTSMNCNYTRGSFESDWIQYPVLSAMNCEGSMRDVLGDLSSLYAYSLMNSSAS